MPTLTNISDRDAVKAFTKAGYNHVHTSGDHAILQKTGFPTLSIPLNKEVARFLLKSQIKRAKLTEKEFVKLLEIGSDFPPSPRLPPTLKLRRTSQRAGL